MVAYPGEGAGVIERVPGVRGSGDEGSGGAEGEERSARLSRGGVEMRGALWCQVWLVPS